MRASRLSRRSRLAVFAGLTTLLVLAGATASYALWTASAGFATSAAGATVGVSHALTGSTLAVTYNGTTRTAVGVVTVTNSSSRAGTYSLGISATSASSPLRSAVVVEVGSTASCTATATLDGAVTGTFAATVTKTAAIAANTSVALCVRTSISAANVTANPSTSLAATVATSVAVGTWSAVATPAITFTQSVAAATQTVDSAAWYWLRSTINTTLCAEGLNSGSGTGTAVVQGTCTAPTGSDAAELFRFVPTTGGFYRIVYKNAPTLALASNGSFSGGGNGGGTFRDAFLTSTSSDLAEWQVQFNADSTVTLLLRNNTTRCLTIPNGSSTAGVQLQLQGCVGDATQKFTLTMFKVATPAPVALTCNADGYNAYYTWPAPTGYETEVVYRVYINNILVSPHSRGTGWDPTVQLSNGTITTATYGSGSKPVLVQQNVNNAGWTTTGTGTLVIANAAPFLLCG